MPAAYPGSGIPGSEAQCILNGNLPLNGNVAKRSASFYEVYGKVNITLNDQFAVGFNEYYAPDFFNVGAWGNYTSVTAKWTAPSTIFSLSGIGMYISGEFGRQWVGKTDAFYGVMSPLGNFAAGIPEPSYNTWSIGVGFTYKVFTLDVRYSDTNLSKGFVQRLHQRLLDHELQPGLHHGDQPGRVRLQLVRRDQHRQAVGRPDRGEQSEVSLNRSTVSTDRPRVSARFPIDDDADG